MRKGSKKLEHCRFIDFSPCIPDNPESPICKNGHGFSSDCMEENPCPDYKYSWGISLEEVKRTLGLDK